MSEMNQAQDVSAACWNSYSLPETLLTHGLVHIFDHRDYKVASTDLNSKLNERILWALSP